MTACVRRPPAGVVEFSNVRFDSGRSRTISVLTARGVVAIDTWHDGQPAGRTLVVRLDIAVLRRAISAATDTSTVGVVQAGSLTPTPNGISHDVWASRLPHDGTGHVCLARLSPQGFLVGDTIILSGPELDAIDAALGWLEASA